MRLMIWAGISRCYEPPFLFPAQFFQVKFASRRGTAVMAGFDVNQLFGLPAAEIFCSPPPGCMLVEAPGDIDSDTGVECVVGAEDDIDGPVHGSQAG